MARRMTGTRTPAFALAFASALALAACTYEEDPGEGSGEVVESTQSLAAMLADHDDIGETVEAMNDTGLMEVFDGTAYYTLLAPTDDAFAGLGEVDETEDEETRNAALAAVLRDHILPGSLTTEDIEDAIAASGEDSVRIQTMGDHTLTFTQQGENVQVSSDDGVEAMLLAGEGRASNGVVIPVDGVLKQL